MHSSLDKIDAACSVFTFGYGTDHDENMLKEIAEAGRGLYYFIEGLDDIPKSFGDCLGGLLSVVAQNMSLNLEGVGGITIKKLMSKVKGHENVTGDKVDINLGDIYSEESRDIVVMINVPAITAPINEFSPAVNIKLTYFNVTSNKQEQRTTTGYIKRPSETPADQPINLNIDRQRNRLTAAAAMDQASNVNKSDKDARGNARDILEAAIKSIKQSATAEDKMCIALVNDLQESVGELEDRNNDYVSVQKKMFAKGGCHSRQRGQVDMYENSAKNKMKEKASSLAKR